MPTYFLIDEKPIIKEQKRCIAEIIDMMLIKFEVHSLNEDDQK